MCEKARRKMAWALNFLWILNVSDSDKTKENVKKNCFDFFVYERHDPWHTWLDHICGPCYLGGYVPKKYRKYQNRKWAMESIANTKFWYQIFNCQ
jgi:hypothetical protein